jgi:hypothetical protein
MDVGLKALKFNFSMLLILSTFLENIFFKKLNKLAIILIMPVIE